jgi:hypothetical protein
MTTVRRGVHVVDTLPDLVQHVLTEPSTAFEQCFELGRLGVSYQGRHGSRLPRDGQDTWIVPTIRPKFPARSVAARWIVYVPLYLSAGTANERVP